MSKMLQVRNVPDDVHARLKERASAAGMSLSEYVLRELRELSERPTLDEVFARAEQRGGRFSFEEINQIIREDRESH